MRILTPTIVALAICSAQAPAAAEAAKKPPDVLLVIGDDMTWRDCEPYGNAEVRTPNMAKLARQGLCFDSMFTATAMCAPTRQQLYTGMFPVRNGAYPNHSRVYGGVTSVVHHLTARGYRVGLLGKRHIGPAASFPFEPVGAAGGKGGADDTAAIAAFVNKDPARPYCLIVASNEPHTPWNKKKLELTYDAAKLKVPPYLIDCPATRADLVRYYAEITYLDGQLGACMDIVDRSGRAQNSMVIFTSEQGSSFPLGGKWTCYETGLKTAFIVRWPAVVAPGTRNGALTQYVDVVPTLLEAAGANPAAIDTGRPDTTGYRGFDGRSFLAVLKGETAQHRDYVYGAHTTRGIIRGSGCYPVRSVRSRRYKYIRNPNHTATFYNVVSTERNGIYAAWRKWAATHPETADRVRLYERRPAEELYDLERDPYELENLAGRPELAAVQAGLGAELARWMRQQGDEGNATELEACERQGARGNPAWKPYDPAAARKGT